jgi:fucose permease
MLCVRTEPELEPWCNEVAIVGGAVVPPLTGHMADLIGLRAALFVPGICYAGILAYGIYARRPAALCANPSAS